MKTALTSAAFLFFLSACSAQEPVATTYKKSIPAGAAPAPGNPPGTGNSTPAPGPGATTPAPAPSGGANDAVAKGKLFFTKAGSCSGCHGAEGKGATPLPPGPYDDASFADAKGLTPAHATPWPTTPDDTKNVIAYMSTFK